MHVDFNNVRIQAIHSYNSLVKKLNNSIDKTVGGWEKVEVDVDDISEDIEDLRRLIGIMACVFKEGDEDFKMVYTDDIEMLSFNPENEDAPQNTSEAVENIG
jgi:hypothetical protein